MRVAVLSAAGLSAVAAIVHAIVTPEHFEEWWATGAFFLGLALFQAAYALALIRTRPAGRFLIRTGIAANLAVILIYLISRTFGVPLGPHAGEREGVGFLDMIATTAEVVMIMLLAWLGRRIAAARVAKGYGTAEVVESDQAAR